MKKKSKGNKSPSEEKVEKKKSKGNKSPSEEKIVKKKSKGNKSPSEEKVEKKKSKGAKAPSEEKKKSKNIKAPSVENVEKKKPIKASEEKTKPTLDETLELISQKMKQINSKSNLPTKRDGIKPNKKDDVIPEEAEEIIIPEEEREFLEAIGDDDIVLNIDDDEDYKEEVEDLKDVEKVKEEVKEEVKEVKKQPELQKPVLKKQKRQTTLDINPAPTQTSTPIQENKSIGIENINVIVDSLDNVSIIDILSSNENPDMSNMINNMLAIS